MGGYWHAGWLVGWLGWVAFLLPMLASPNPTRVTTTAAPSPTVIPSPSGGNTPRGTLLKAAHTHTPYNPMWVWQRHDLVSHQNEREGDAPTPSFTLASTPMAATTLFSLDQLAAPLLPPHFSYLYTLHGWCSDGQSAVIQIWVQFQTLQDKVNVYATKHRSMTQALCHRQRVGPGCDATTLNSGYQHTNWRFPSEPRWVELTKGSRRRAGTYFLQSPLGGTLHHTRTFHPPSYDTCTGSISSLYV